MMTMRRQLIYIGLLLYGLTSSMSAQKPVFDAVNAFALIPTDICPYLDMQQRLYISGNYALNISTDTIPNLLEGKSYVTSYDVYSFGIQLTPNLHWTVTSDSSTVTIVEDLCAPRCAHTTYTYSMNDWQLLNIERLPMELETEEEMIVY